MKTSTASRSEKHTQVVEMSDSSADHSKIAECAYNLWLSRGCPEGTPERDWLEAEKLLRIEGAEVRTRNRGNGSASRGQATIGTRR